METLPKPTTSSVIRILRREIPRQLDPSKGEFAYAAGASFKVYDPKLKAMRIVKQDLGLPAQPPTVSEVKLGERFINYAAMLGADWDSSIEEAPRHWPESLRNLFAEAQDQINEYVDRHGLIDGENEEELIITVAYRTPTGDRLLVREKRSFLALRRPVIGDVVSFVRKSSDDLLDLYEEPEEDRPSTTPGAPFSPNRYDRDARWEAPQDEIWSEKSGELVCFDLADPQTRRFFNNL